MKNVYEPMLNHRPAQNTSFNCNSTLFQSTFRRRTTNRSRHPAFFIFLFCVSNSIFAMCDVELEKAVSLTSTVVPFGLAASAKDNKAVIRRFHAESIKNGFMKFRDEKDQINQKEFLSYAAQEVKGLREILSTNRLDQNTDLRASMLPYWEMVVCLGNSLGSTKSGVAISTTPPPPTYPVQQQNNSPQQTQQQPQQAQQQAQQAQEAARVAQTRADQARQGKRKTHDPAAEAHQCIEIDKDPGLFGAFKNTCGYKVNFSTCNYRPRVRQGGFNWSADFDCEQQKFGLHTPDGGRAVASHNRNTEMVHWFACKAPAFPVDTEFVSGGVRGRCN